MKNSSSGFTLVELIIFLGIFAFASAAFISILLTVTRVQVRESSVAEVSEQSQFLLQQIQYYIERSSMVDIATDAPTSTLKLWMGVAAQDPTYIYLSTSTGIVYLQQTATGTPQALTSNKITVQNLAFTRRANVPSHDAVSVSFTLAYNTSNIQQAFSEMLQTSIARVSAATFDSDILPSTSTALNLGLSGQKWNSINQNIYFSGANVGIGNPSPSYALDIAGGLEVTQTSTFSGKVGIGTTNPSSTLHIFGSGQTLYLSGAGTASQSIRMTNTGGDLGLGIESSAGGALLTGSLPYATILGTASANTTALQFGTGSYARMTIASSGYVGVGTTNPEAELHVAQGVKTVGTTEVAWFSTTEPIQNNPLSFEIKLQGGPNSDNRGVILTPTEDGDTENFLQIGDEGWATFLPNGNVGIGTTGPNNTLDVDGGVRIETNHSQSVVCYLNTSGDLGHCTSAVGSGGTCTCAAN